MTVKEGTRVPDRLVVIDNGSRQDIAMFRGLYDMWSWQPENLGVAGSCNEALRIAAIPRGGFWLHANDDIEISRDAIQGLEEGATTNPGHMMYVPQHNAGSAFTFFLMPAQRALDEIGLWDEEFFPAYFEDNDYAYRMGMKGYKYVTVPTGSYVHHTSSTKNSYSGDEVNWGHERFRTNQARYIKKWGGLPGDEKFTVPFNGVAE